MKTMFRQVHTFLCLRSISLGRIRGFLTADYQCNDAWNTHSTNLPIVKDLNLNDFYNKLDQNYSSKGMISAVDVDIFANAVKDSTYLEELKDLLHKLRLSAETGSTLESTHYATIRNFIQFEFYQELIDILKDPLNFGLFLDNYTANMLMDNLITSENYKLAADVASLIMLQEDYCNNITNSLCQYACYKYVSEYQAPPEEPEKKDKNTKVDEIKIRVKFLRNPYFDDHFDIKDTYILSGKTLAWISEQANDNLNNNIQLIGWAIYGKYDKLLATCKKICKNDSVKVYSEVIDLISKQKNESNNATIESCLEQLSSLPKMDSSLEKDLKEQIENAINKNQNQDITSQKQLFENWAKTRYEKFEEQKIRMDRAKRMQNIQEKQKQLAEEEQKLWFFENEDAIDLRIEEKEKFVETTTDKKNSSSGKDDENYIPPEILPKRR